MIKTKLATRILRFNFLNFSTSTWGASLAYLQYQPTACLSWWRLITRKELPTIFVTRRGAVKSRIGQEDSCGCSSTPRHSSPQDCRDYVDDLLQGDSNLFKGALLKRGGTHMATLQSCSLSNCMRDNFHRCAHKWSSNLRRTGGCIGFLWGLKR